MELKWVLTLGGFSLAEEGKEAEDDLARPRQGWHWVWGGADGQQGTSCGKIQGGDQLEEVMIQILPKLLSIFKVIKIKFTIFGF